MKRVFIGSSFEARHLVERVAEILIDRGVEPIKWIDNFRSGDIILERIEEISDRINGALILATPDDETKKRIDEESEIVKSPRANVMFEYGYFMGVLGRKTNRLALCKFDKANLPSDLGGVTHIQMGVFDPAESAQISNNAASQIRAWADSLSLMVGRSEVSGTAIAQRPRQAFKLMYNKFYHLRNMEVFAPAYTRRIERFGKRKDVDVYDEFHAYRMNVFYEEQEDFATRDRTTGAVELQALHPPQPEWQILPNVAADPWHLDLRAKCRVASKIFFTKAIYYNGFQQDNHDLGTRVEVDTEEVHLIADFTLIPNFSEQLRGEPTAVLVRHDQHAVPIEVVRLHPAIWKVTSRNLGRSDAVQLDFVLDW